jgi:hypothetical protein
MFFTQKNKKETKNSHAILQEKKINFSSSLLSRFLNFFFLSFFFTRLCHARTHQLWSCHLSEKNKKKNETTVTFHPQAPFSCLMGGVEIRYETKQSSSFFLLVSVVIRQVLLFCFGYGSFGFIPSRQTKKKRK